MGLVMNADEVKDTIGGLTFIEIGFLNKLANLVDRAGYPTSTREFGVCARLNQKKLIHAYGRNGRLTRWQLDEAIFRHGRDILRQMGGQDGR